MWKIKELLGNIKGEARPQEVTPVEDLTTVEKQNTAVSKYAKMYEGILRSGFTSLDELSRLHNLAQSQLERMSSRNFSTNEELDLLIEECKRELEELSRS